MKRAIFGAVVLSLAAGLAWTVSLRGGSQEPFPHEAHTGLFPFCTGCHVGVPDGDVAGYYPEPQLCARCHDGEQEERVEWTPPAAGAPSPVRFTHPDHSTAVAAADEDALDCAECHVQAGGEPMQVERRQVVSQCLSCHGHAADDHLVDAPCSTCHGPAAETPMGGEWLAMLPYPADHATAGFLGETHGELATMEPARCATCHTQERCTSCHVNADAVPEIAGVPEAPPSLELPRYAAHYVAPPSHSDPEFLDRHGEQASVQACATCHTQDDCAACHAAEQPEPIPSLARAEEVRAPGVLLEPKPPSSHTVASFTTEHGGLAAADASSCASCHTRTFCSDCHDAAAVAVTLPTEIAGGAFHPPNFMARHASEAYGRRLECSSCHDTGAFCRECHEQAGFQSSGRLGQGFHDAEPTWLLRHGLPARQALESCASCHTQTDCLQCHSTLGAFKVSPHGSDFDPEAARAKNPAICLACHVNDPLGGT
ncbi:MAG: cytochrome c3 family protein [Gemmatimonadota bacterium]